MEGVQGEGMDSDEIRRPGTRPRNPSKSNEIHGNPRFQLIGGGPGGGNGLRRNQWGPTLDLEIIGNPTKSMGILGFKWLEGVQGEGIDSVALVMLRHYASKSLEILQNQMKS